MWKLFCFFIAASSNPDLDLHLVAGEALSKFFFAMDRIKYSRLWPRYIADMHELKISNPDTWKELKEGNISVTKNKILFVSIGADHACEQVNKHMKTKTRANRVTILSQLAHFLPYYGTFVKCKGNRMFYVNVFIIF